MAEYRFTEVELNRGRVKVVAWGRNVRDGLVGSVGSGGSRRSGLDVDSDKGMAEMSLCTRA